MDKIAVLIHHNGSWKPNHTFSNYRAAGVVLPKQLSFHDFVGILSETLELDQCTETLEIQFQVQFAHPPMAIRDDMSLSFFMHVRDTTNDNLKFPLCTKSVLKQSIPVPVPTPAPVPVPIPEPEPVKVKRGRISVVSDIERNGTEPEEFSHILMSYSGPSFSDLPGEIMVNILLKLSVKTIFVCKFVCKTWHDLISKPEFAKLHFGQAQAYPLIQISGNRVQSRMLYLVHPEEECFEHKLEMCDHVENECECDNHVMFELDTKFKLPLRNLQMISDDKDSGRNMLDHVSGEESNDWIRLKMKNHKYNVVNSCNGMVCLSSPSDNDPLVVCNPVTGEFIHLPEAKKVHLRGGVMHCGFGYSPATNQYKVIKMYKHWTRHVKTMRYIDSSMGAEVHTLGTETWKEIDFPFKDLCGLCPTYLNGFLYWPYHVPTFCVFSFDIENECFGSISVSPLNDSTLYDVSLGVLGGELSICCDFSRGVGVWVLKDDGTRNVWSNVFSIDNEYEERLPYGSCQLIKYLSDGALLMFNPSEKSLIYAHPGKLRFRYFKFCGTETELKVIAHTPSFVSLRDSLSGHNVNVLNIKSRCVELKLRNEDQVIYVLEKDIWWNLSLQSHSMSPLEVGAVVSVLLGFAPPAKLSDDGSAKVFLMITVVV